MKIQKLFNALKLSWVLFALLICPLQNKGQDYQQLPDNIKKLLQSEAGWDKLDYQMKLNGKPHFRFEKIGEENKDAKHYVRYRAFVNDLKTDIEYNLSLMTMTGEIQQFPVKIYLNSKGLLLTHKPTPEQMQSDSLPEADELELAMTASKGEPFRYSLTDKKAKIIILGTLVPYPIVASSGDCRMELRRSMPNAEALLFSISGFPPNSDVSVDSTSEKESRSYSMHTDENGYAMTAVLPSVVGKESGIDTETIASKTCGGSVSIHWGKGSYQTE